MQYEGLDVHKCSMAFSDKKAALFLTPIFFVKRIYSQEFHTTKYVLLSVNIRRCIEKPSTERIVAGWRVWGCEIYIFSFYFYFRISGRNRSFQNGGVRRLEI